MSRGFGKMELIGNLEKNGFSGFQQRKHDWRRLKRDYKVRKRTP